MRTKEPAETKSATQRPIKAHGLSANLRIYGRVKEKLVKAAKTNCISETYLASCLLEESIGRLDAGIIALSWPGGEG